MVMAGGLVFVASLPLLHLYSKEVFESKEETTTIAAKTLWGLTTREPVILTVLAVAAAALALTAVLTDLEILDVLATALSFYLLGRFFDIGARTYNFYAEELWVGTAALVAMSVGGLLAITGAIRRKPVALSTSAEQTQRLLPAQAPAAAAAGWYPDPSQAGRQRYWSGIAWTDRVTP